MNASGDRPTVFAKITGNAQPDPERINQSSQACTTHMRCDQYQRFYLGLPFTMTIQHFQPDQSTHGMTNDLHRCVRVLGDRLASNGCVGSRPLSLSLQLGV